MHMFDARVRTTVGGSFVWVVYVTEAFGSLRDSSGGNESKCWK